MTTLTEMMNSHVSSVFLNRQFSTPENVVFKDYSGAQADSAFQALVDLDEPIRDDSGLSPTLFTGRIYFEGAKRPQIASQTALTVSVRGDDFDVVEIGADEFGFVQVGIRREIPAHSNAVDLQGTQHRYA